MKMAKAKIQIKKISGRAISDCECQLIVSSKVVARSDFQSSSAIGRAKAIDLILAVAERRGIEAKLDTW